MSKIAIEPAFVVADTTRGPRAHEYLGIGEGRIGYTSDVDKAIVFARRVDAEKAAWQGCIVLPFAGEFKAGAWPLSTQQKFPDTYAAAVAELARRAEVVNAWPVELVAPDLLRAPLTPEQKATTGIFRKYSVRRTDGTDGPGGKHANCKLFVLDLTHDKHAEAAVRAYAASAATERPALASDLLAQLPPVKQGIQMLGDEPESLARLADRFLAVFDLMTNALDIDVDETIVRVMAVKPGTEDKQLAAVNVGELRTQLVAALVREGVRS